MSTGISWTDETWNPVLGCSKVSPGCDSCYAIGNARIRQANPNAKIASAYAGLVERTDAGLDWTGAVNLLPERLDIPLRWKKPRLIFVNSMADLFHEQVPGQFIARVFAAMASSPQHTFQILTKRHARMRSVLSDQGFRQQVWDAVRALHRERVSGTPGRHYMPSELVWPLPNVWLGVSIENQKWADIRIPYLLDTPAAIRWLSMEPLLNPIDLHGPLDPSGIHRPSLTYWLTGRPSWSADGVLKVTRGIDWVVAGGESGSSARPMHPDWVRTIRDQVTLSGVPFHFKQWGAWAPIAPDQAKVGDVVLHRDGEHFPLTASLFDGIDVERRREMYVLRKVGQKAAGRELDGRIHDAYPDTRIGATA